MWSARDRDRGVLNFLTPTPIYTAQSSGSDVLSSKGDHFKGNNSTRQPPPSRMRSPLSVPGLHLEGARLALSNSPVPWHPPMSLQVGLLRAPLGSPHNALDWFPSPALREQVPSSHSSVIEIDLWFHPAVASFKHPEVPKSRCLRNILFLPSHSCPIPNLSFSRLFSYTPTHSSKG